MWCGYCGKTVPVFGELVKSPRAALILGMLGKQPRHTECTAALPWAAEWNQMCTSREITFGDDWTDWVGGQREDPPRGTWLMQTWQPHESFCCGEFLVGAAQGREWKPSSAPSCQEISWLDPWSREDSRYEGEEITEFMDSHKGHGVRAQESHSLSAYLWFQTNTKISNTHYCIFKRCPQTSPLPLNSGFPVKSRILSPEFTPTVSHTLLKAHQSNSSEELTNAAQPTKSGHTREKDREFATAGEPFGSWSGAQMDWKKKRHLARKVQTENSPRSRGVAKPWPCQNIFTGAKMHSEKNAIHLH